MVWVIGFEFLSRLYRKVHDFMLLWALSLSSNKVNWHFSSNLQLKTFSEQISSKWGFMFSTTFGFSSNYFSCTSLDFNYWFMHFIKRGGPYHWWLRFILPPNTNQWSFLHGVSNRARRALENRTMIDDDRIAIMEDQLKQAKYIAEEREQMYEEVCYTVRPN